MNRKRMTMADVNKLPKRMRDQVLEQLNESTIPNRSPSKSSVMESDTRNRTEKTITDKKGNQSTHVCVRGVTRLVVEHYRKRLIDYDNLHIKNFLDILVKKGILRDDNAKEIKEIVHRQYKTKDNERTIFKLMGE